MRSEAFQPPSQTNEMRGDEQNGASVSCVVGSGGNVWYLPMWATDPTP